MLKQLFVTGLVLATAVASSPSAEATTSVPYWRCFAATALVPIAERLSKSSTNVRDETFHLRDSGNEYQLSGPGLSQPISAAKPQADPCAAVPPNLRVSGETAIPGRNLADLVAVLAFKRTFTWPVMPARLEDPHTYLVLRTFDGNHDIVSFAPSEPLRNERGQPVLGCGGDEYYRVDAPTLRVLPFEGCIEGGGRTMPGIPHFRQLPR
jgi:hypothetical protein